MNIDNLVSISRLVMRLGRVERITLDSQLRPESDTTHTVMLALIAGALCDDETGRLDREAVIGMALIHDIAEAYAGDTPTLRPLSAEEEQGKREREHAGLRKALVDMKGSQWLIEMVNRYQAQRCRESRFVRILDKMLPKLTHFDNGCAVPLAQGMSLEEFVSVHSVQIDKLSDIAQDLPVARLMHSLACRASEAAWPRIVNRTCIEPTEYTLPTDSASYYIETDWQDDCAEDYSFTQNAYFRIKNCPITGTIPFCAFTPFNFKAHHGAFRALWDVHLATDCDGINKLIG